MCHGSPRFLWIFTSHWDYLSDLLRLEYALEHVGAARQPALARSTQPTPCNPTDAKKRYNQQTDKKAERNETLHETFSNILNMKVATKDAL